MRVQVVSPNTHPLWTTCPTAASWKLSVKARTFYEHLIPEFERSPTDPLHLLLLLKDIRRTLGR